MLSLLHEFSDLMLTVTLWERYCHLRSLRRRLETGFEHRQFGPRARALNHYYFCLLRRGKKGHRAGTIRKQWTQI